MNPIINPIWFYIISLIKNISFMAGLIFVITLIITIIGVLLLYGEFYMEDEPLEEASKKIKFMFRIPLIILIISGSVGTILPTEETMYKIMIASYITENNIEIAKDEVKELIDYISEKLKGE
jgi:hypothetical protein